MWMEESIGKKVNDERAEELIATGASKVATACPFCYIMLDDGVKGAGAEETVQVADISMHLLAALEAADERAAPAAADARGLTMVLGRKRKDDTLGRHRAPVAGRGAGRQRRPRRLRDARAHGRHARATAPSVPPPTTRPRARLVAELPALRRARPRRAAASAPSLKVLDLIRSHDDQRVSSARGSCCARRARRTARSRFQSGADSFVVRPFHIDELVAQIADVLGRPNEDRARHRRDELARLGD